MDYETFGEHQGAHTGILEFMRCLPEQVLKRTDFRFRTPAQVAAEREAAAELDVPTPVSWADAERNLTAWLGNPMQTAAHAALYALRPDVLAVADERPDLLAAWRKLTTSDHVYYAATKHHSDAEVHEYFSPYDSPHAAFVTFMSAVDHLRAQVGKAKKPPRKRSQ
jgi:alpha-amylase